MRAWPVLLLFIWSAAAQPAEPDPAEPVRALASAIEALRPPVTVETLETAIAGQFDLLAFAEDALGERTASSTQLGRLARISARRFASDVIDQWPDEAASWVVSETRPIDSGGWLVTTVSEVAGSEPQTLQWRIAAGADRLRIADVLKGGASYAAAFGRDLDRALRTRTLDDVLARLEERYGLTAAPP